MNDEMQEILSDFLVESSEMLEALDQHFVKLESEPTNADLLNEIFRCMHSMKGSAGFLGFYPFGRSCASGRKPPQ